MMSRWPRALVQSALLVGTLLVLSACSDDTTEPSVQPSEAKQSVIEFVEQSTTAAGGTWGTSAVPASESASKTPVHPARCSSTS